MKHRLLLLVCVLIGLISCQKKIESGHAAKTFNYNRFFSELKNTDPGVMKVFEYLKSENSKKDFLSAFVEAAGYPRWDKALVKKAADLQNIVFVNTAYQQNDMICIIPLVSENNTSITGMLIAELLNDKVQCRYSLLVDYKKMGDFKEKFVLSMIQLEKLVFGHTSFKVYDHSVLGPANTILLKKRQQQVTSTVAEANTYDDPCEIEEIWHDPTGEECHCSGDELYTGKWYYVGDCFEPQNLPYILPLGGGSSYSLPGPQPGSGGTGGPSIPPYASTFTEKLNYLLNNLDMTPASSDFLPTDEPTVNEMYSYLYNNASDERKEIASDHIQKLLQILSMMHLLTIIVQAREIQ